MTAATGTCPNCQNPIDPDVSFCPGCGQPAGGSGIPGQASTQQGNLRSTLQYASGPRPGPPPPGGAGTGTSATSPDPTAAAPLTPVPAAPGSDGPAAGAGAHAGPAAPNPSLTTTGPVGVVPPAGSTPPPGPVAGDHTLFSGTPVPAGSYVPPDLAPPRRKTPVVALSAMGGLALVLVVVLLVVVIQRPTGDGPPPSSSSTTATAAPKPAQVAITPSPTVPEGQALPVNLVADRTDHIVRTRLIVESIGAVAEQPGYATSLSWPAPPAGQHSLVGELVLDDGTTVRSPAAVATVTPKPVVVQSPNTQPPPPAPTPAPVAPSSGSTDAETRAAALSLVNELEQAYADGRWTTVRRLAPARADYTDARMEEGWGTLQSFAIYPVSVTPSGGRTRVRGGLVTNESGPMPESSYTGRFSQVFCVTWLVDTDNRTVEELGPEIRRIDQIRGGLAELSDRRDQVLREC